MEMSADRKVAEL